MFTSIAHATSVCAGEMCYPAAQRSCSLLAPGLQRNCEAVAFNILALLEQWTMPAHDSRVRTPTLPSAHAPRARQHAHPHKHTTRIHAPFAPRSGPLRALPCTHSLQLGLNGGKWAIVAVKLSGREVAVLAMCVEAKEGDAAMQSRVVNVVLLFSTAPSTRGTQN